MSVSCFAQRLLNPFRGVMNVIRYGAAEAVTTDGVHWEIYVSNEELLRGMDTDQYIQTSDIRYGSWSLEHGLKRGPIYPSEDFKRMEQLGAHVYENLLQCHQDIPFEFKDIYELWLLDKNDLPLALLDSVNNMQEIYHDKPLTWRSGNLCQASFFPDIELEMMDDTNPSQLLASYINNLSGTPPRAQWFARESNGSGIGLSGIHLDTEAERILPAECFPPYFINTQGHEAPFAELADAYIEWQAPWLLLLHQLEKDTRQHFEQLARRQAMVVDIQQRLYPEVIDQSVINSARVEAMMRRAQPDPVKQEEQAISTWYLELGENERGK